MPSSATGHTRAQGIRYAVLIFAALALSACGSVFGDDPGEVIAHDTLPSGDQHRTAGKGFAVFVQVQLRHGGVSVRP